MGSQKSRTRQLFLRDPSSAQGEFARSDVRLGWRGKYLSLPPRFAGGYSGFKFRSVVSFAISLSMIFSAQSLQ